MAMTYDTAIIGAGLTGLSCAIELLQRRRSVIVLERADRVGGLCGTFQRGAAEYSIACNDFGGDLVDALSSLGVDLKFRSKRTLIDVGGETFEFPLAATSVSTLARRPGSLLKSAFSYVRAHLAGALEGADMLGPWVDTFAQGDLLRVLLKSPAYFMGVPPTQFHRNYLAFEREFSYGHDRPGAPEGGPQAMSNAMARRVLELGGKILLNCEYFAHTQRTGCFLLRSSQGSMRCRSMVATHAGNGRPHGDSDLTAPVKEGMCATIWGLRLDGTQLAWPKDTHTIAFLPGTDSDWSEQLDQGRCPSEFGFHLYSSFDPDALGRYSVNVSLLTPRGAHTWPADQKERAQAYILQRISQRFPVLRSAILEAHWIDPAYFHVLHGVYPRIMPLVDDGQRNPDNQEVAGVFYAGKLRFPPGDHAGACVRSALRVASLVDRRLQHQPEASRSTPSSML